MKKAKKNKMKIGMSLICLRKLKGSRRSLNNQEFDTHKEILSNRPMPMFILNTNVSSLDYNSCELIRGEAVNIISTEIGKSPDFIVTLINQSVNLKFGQSDDPCAYIEIKNVGQLPEEKTTALSHKFAELLFDKVGISKDKAYIEFQESPRHLWGWNGKTFA